MAVEDDYTEERLAEYDAAAIAQDDVIVIGFVTVVRNLRARVAAAQHQVGAIRRVVDEWSGAHSMAVEILGRVQTLVQHYDHVEYDPTCPLCTKPKTA